MSRRWKISLIVVGVHTMIVLLVASAVGSMISDYPESVMLWAPMALIDWPSSRVFAFAVSWITDWPHDVRFVYGYAVYLAVFGGIQYFLLSFAICSLMQRRQQTSNERRRTIV